MSRWLMRPHVSFLWSHHVPGSHKGLKGVQLYFCTYKPGIYIHRTTNRERLSQSRNDENKQKNITKPRKTRTPQHHHNGNTFHRNINTNRVVTDNTNASHRSIKHQHLHKYHQNPYTNTNTTNATTTAYPFPRHPHPHYHHHHPHL